ncbi:uncharacterized protein LOC129601678 [Paramacrobiotus metropolitanus]|uniref:uncharacterized protein LOC129601678 n=1 Tax=Paramacrobiotus metropolitanus TaxID=2943436 RepID=UPI0024458A5F|nr:uncharacterized protein LOC129601678 [Paramacrobiotus metropolitanus]
MDSSTPHFVVRDVHWPSNKSYSCNKVPLCKSLHMLHPCIQVAKGELHVSPSVGCAFPEDFNDLLNLFLYPCKMIFALNLTNVAVCLLLRVLMVKAYRGEPDAYYIQPSLQLSGGRVPPVYSPNRQLVRNPPKIPQNAPYVLPYEDSPGAGYGPVRWKGQHGGASVTTTIRPSPTTLPSVCSASTLVSTRTVRTCSRASSTAIPCVTVTVTVKTTATTVLCTTNALTLYEAVSTEGVPSITTYTPFAGQSCMALSENIITASTSGNSPCFDITVTAIKFVGIGCTLAAQTTVYGTGVTTNAQNSPSYSSGAFASTITAATPLQCA